MKAIFSRRTLFVIACALLAGTACTQTGRYSSTQSSSGTVSGQMSATPSQGTTSTSRQGTMNQGYGPATPSGSESGGGGTGGATAK